MNDVPVRQRPGTTVGRIGRFELEIRVTIEILLENVPRNSRIPLLLVRQNDLNSGQGFHYMTAFAQLGVQSSATLYLRRERDRLRLYRCRLRRFAAPLVVDHRSYVISSFG
jgi:hypothetical protein